ncbi:hypothetical protein IFM89_029711 [Coptis chinensis]|uniref:Uncharacterized protein n=1 Tax=Coptis chinensis TaxID=261450 RepID=A0A835LFI7_9MAGN|nr:hypothetical protein IFM89_029711 [Coptis chinensis]
MATQEENHIDSADLFSIIQQRDQEVGPTLADDEQEHYLESMHSKLVIRQLPHKGSRSKYGLQPTLFLVSLLEQYHNQPSNNPLSPILKSRSPARSRTSVNRSCWYCDSLLFFMPMSLSSTAPCPSQYPVQCHS